MIMNTWPFSDPPNVAVFTSKTIIDKSDWIQTVTHDEGDGAWQFHPHKGTDESEAKVVSLKTITQIDPTVLSLANLPLGWTAWRNAKDGQWKREKV